MSFTESTGWQAVVWRRLAVAAISLVGVAAAADDDSRVRSELSTLLSAADAEEFAFATEARHFEFPRDHGPHPEFRNEWWYLTGNLDATDGRRFGFELTFFRFALASGQPASDSAWRTNQIYIAHLAVADADDQRFLVAERYSRGALGLAGAQAGPFRVWIDDWQIAEVQPASDREHWRLQGNAEEFGLTLDLIAEKRPVLNGDAGLSQKSAEPGNASYYYSITRWQTTGLLRLADQVHSVSGSSWLDREWSSSALGAAQAGWDWFALQLSDGSELMYYHLRKTDGSRDTYSGGTWIAADGQSHHIAADELSVSVLKTWPSPAGGVYPSAWAISYPARSLRVEVRPVMDDQELFTTVRYWEGAVDVRGTRDDLPVSGRGYVELTGYADGND